LATGKLRFKEEGLDVPKVIDGNKSKTIFCDHPTKKRRVRANDQLGGGPLVKNLKDLGGVHHEKEKVKTFGGKAIAGKV